MKEEKISVGKKELHRWHLMKMVEVGKITLEEASENIGMLYPQAKRIGRAILERGIQGLVHGNQLSDIDKSFKEVYGVGSE